jgi:hypothetical protein
MPNRKFWMAKVDEWNLDSAEEAKQSLCGNCAAFDQRQATLDCIAQGIDSDDPEDAQGVIDAGELGYCKFLKFKCASRRTCDAWVTGGPLTDQQDVDEMAGEIAGGVRQVLDKKGYELLGDGIDKEAYLEPGTGQVLVIFGYGAGKNKFSKDQMMFVNWAKYCQQNQSNPHLPRFSGWESFDYKGKRYLQIRMEPLQEVSELVKDIVWWLASYVKAQGKIDSNKIAKQIGKQGVEDYDEGDFSRKKVKAKKIIEYLGGPDAAAGLMKTVQIAKKMSKKQGYSLDLHGGNYMQRADGTIVVNDPFVLSFDLY